MNTFYLSTNILIGSLNTGVCAQLLFWNHAGADSATKHREFSNVPYRRKLSTSYAIYV